MAIIDISGLEKADVIFALFENVFLKSEESKKLESHLYLRDEIGIYSMPHRYEINQVVKKFIQGRNPIDRIGCVRFNMDISTTTLNTDFYDNHHQTGTNGIKPATVIINRLKEENEKKQTYYKNLYEKLGVSTTQQTAPSSSNLTNTSVSTFFQKDINSDRRFTKSQEPGILYIAKSYGYLEDEILEGYGFKKGQWERSKEGIDNIVIIKALNKEINDYSPKV